MIEPLEVLVKAGNHDRSACPVWVQLPIPGAGVPDYRMTDEGGAPVALPGGAVRDRRRRPAVALLDRARSPRRGGAALPHRAPVRHPGRGRPPEATDHGPGVVLEELPDGQLGVTRRREHLTTYNFGSDVVRPYFFPLIGPTGANVVRSWPMVEGVVGETSDHPHHKGLYVAHGDVNGADNWERGAQSLHHAPRRLRPPRLRPRLRLLRRDGGVARPRGPASC